MWVTIFISTSKLIKNQNVIAGKDLGAVFPLRISIAAISFPILCSNETASSQMFNYIVPDFWLN